MFVTLSLVVMNEHGEVACSETQSWKIKAEHEGVLCSNTFEVKNASYLFIQSC